mmetsp:Transcript_23154/g.50833  ORF Transcript_23154/g.50833 Transcript_23154/m.50833 type:complete len:564 (+) Transcript_23154:1196-2887(+)
MQLTHTLNHGLAGLLIAAVVEGGILLGQLVQAHAHLLQISLGLGLNGNLDDWVREVHLLQDDGVLLIAQGVTSDHILEATDGNNVTGEGGLDVLTVVGVHEHEATNALLLALVGVEGVGAGLQGAGVDAAEGDGADKGVSHDLEGQGGEGGLVLGSAAQGNLGVVDVHTLDISNVQRGRQVVSDSVQQGLHTLVLEGGTADHGGEHLVDGTLADQPLDGSLIGHGAIEVGGQHVVVQLHNVIDQLLAVLLGLGLHVIRDVALLKLGTQLLTSPDNSLHLDQVNHALELLLRANGQLDDQGLGTQVLNHHLHAVVEVSTQAIHLVHKGNTGHLVLVSLAPHSLRLGLHTRHSVKDRDGTVQHTQGTLDLEGEVHVARGVNDVDTVALPCASGGSSRDGDTTLLLLDHPVHGGSALMHLSNLVALASVVQNALGGGGLAGINVSHDTDVAVLIQRPLAAVIVVGISSSCSNHAPPGGANGPLAGHGCANLECSVDSACCLGLGSHNCGIPHNWGNQAGDGSRNGLLTANAGRSGDLGVQRHFCLEPRRYTFKKQLPCCLCGLDYG